MSLVNEKAVVNEDKYVRETYRNDFFLQIVLTAVNGVTLVEKDEHGDKSAKDENQPEENTVDPCVCVEGSEFKVAQSHAVRVHEEVAQATKASTMEAWFFLVHVKDVEEQALSDRYEKQDTSNRSHVIQNLDQRPHEGSKEVEDPD